MSDDAEIAVPTAYPAHNTVSIDTTTIVYKPEGFITRWLRSKQELPSERRRKNEELEQYAMDRFIMHQVRKQQNLINYGGTGDVWYAHGENYLKVADKAQELYDQRVLVEKRPLAYGCKDNWTGNFY